MPQTKSAAKRLRQDTLRRERNRSARQSIRTAVRKVRDAVKATNVATAETELKAASKLLDRSAGRGLIHKNRAARTKSRLSAAIKLAKQKKA
jgi:small subunit ribosomal protein S20